MTERVVASVLWRRLDAPGHDACRLTQVEDGWQLDGATAFRHDLGPARLAYELRCDDEWRTRWGIVRGWVGARQVGVTVRRRPDGAWTVNDVPALGVSGCVHLDFGFTPATNLAQLRSIALAAGESAEVPVAWLDVPDGTLEVLQQHYGYRGDGVYWYEAPRFGYAAQLDVTPVGFARRYPGLWEAES